MKMVSGGGLLSPSSYSSSPRSQLWRPCLRPSLTRCTSTIAHYGFVSAASVTSCDAQKTRFFSSVSRGKEKTAFVTRVIPFLMGSAWEQPPPDLASYLYKNRIVYLGMPLGASVIELILAELLYLKLEDDQKPIYLYINSTGTTKDDSKLGYESEALAVYDSMRYVKLPIFTLCVGNAWGEAALLLAAGAKGNRAALPSSSIMIKQPVGRFQGQVTELESARKEITIVKKELVKLFSKHIGKPMKQIEEDMIRPKYFSPTEAVEYGIIDRVLYNGSGGKNVSGVSDLRKAKLI